MQFLTDKKVHIWDDESIIQTAIGEGLLPLMNAFTNGMSLSNSVFPLTGYTWRITESKIEVSHTNYGFLSSYDTFTVSARKKHMVIGPWCVDIRLSRESEGILIGDDSFIETYQSFNADFLPYCRVISALYVQKNKNEVSWNNINRWLVDGMVDALSASQDIPEDEKKSTMDILTSCIESKYLNFGNQN